jgi:hypothetical protein
MAHIAITDRGELRALFDQRSLDLAEVRRRRLILSASRLPFPTRLPYISGFNSPPFRLAHL